MHLASAVLCLVYFIVCLLSIIKLLSRVMAANIWFAWQFWYYCILVEMYMCQSF